AHSMVEHFAVPTSLDLGWPRFRVGHFVAIDVRVTEHRNSCEPARLGAVFASAAQSLRIQMLRFGNGARAVVPTQHGMDPRANGLVMGEAVYHGRLRRQKLLAVRNALGEKLRTCSRDALDDQQAKPGKQQRFERLSEHHDSCTLLPRSVLTVRAATERARHA